MSGPVFVDTSVFVYAVDTTDPAKHRAASAWLSELWGRGLGRTSTQVVQEFYSVLTRKGSSRRSKGAAREIVTPLLLWKPLPVTPSVIAEAWSLEDRYSLSWWDALIVAAAEQSGSRFLLTEDLSPGQKIGDVEVVHPFRQSAASILS